MKISRRFRRLALLAVLLAGLGFTGVSAFFAWRLTGPFSHEVGSVPAGFGWPVEAVRFSAREDAVSLAGWFVPCPGATEAVVLLHGYGYQADRRMMLSRAQWFRSLGYAVLLYDARGHGESGGAFTSMGWWETRDLRGALDWLRGRGFTAFGCVGVSQGGATIALAGAKLDGVRWAVLESVYPTMENAVDRRFRRLLGVSGWLAGCLIVPFAEWRLGVSVRDISPVRHIAELPCPVLVMNGERDEHTMLTDARVLFAAAREPKSFWVVPGAAHEDLFASAREEYQRRLQALITSAH